MQCNPMLPPNESVYRAMDGEKREGAREGGKKRTMMVSTVQHLLINHS